MIIYNNDIIEIIEYSAVDYLKKLIYEFFFIFIDLYMNL